MKLPETLQPTDRDESMCCVVELNASPSCVDDYFFIFGCCFLRLHAICGWMRWSMDETQIKVVLSARHVLSPELTLFFLCFRLTGLLLAHLGHPLFRMRARRRVEVDLDFMYVVVLRREPFHKRKIAQAILNISNRCQSSSELPNFVNFIINLYAKFQYCHSG